MLKITYILLFSLIPIYVQAEVNNQLNEITEKPIVLVAQNSLKQILLKLESKKVLERRKSRLELTNYLNKLSDKRHLRRVNYLINLLPEAEYRTKLGICIALGNLDKNWTSKKHTADIKLLKTLYKNEQNKALKFTIKRAINNAK
jgi:hypothetical protein